MEGDSWSHFYAERERCESWSAGAEELTARPAGTTGDERKKEKLEPEFPDSSFSRTQTDSIYWF
jgi:hypothetical protein